MTAPLVNLANQISQLQTQISYLTAKLACVDQMTEAQSQALGTALVQATVALENLTGTARKTRLPYRVANTHPRW